MRRIINADARVKMPTISKLYKIEKVGREDCKEALYNQLFNDKDKAISWCRRSAIILRNRYYQGEQLMVGENTVTLKGSSFHQWRVIEA